MPHAALCVSRPIVDPYQASAMLFQCRTQHCVCRDLLLIHIRHLRCCFNAARNIVCVETALSTSTWCLVQRFNAARSIVCVETQKLRKHMDGLWSFNAARSIVCVETNKNSASLYSIDEFQCRTQHCVCRDNSVYLRRIRS